MTSFSFVMQFGKLDEPLHEPRGVDQRNEVIAVVDAGLHRVQLFEPTGALLRQWGHYGNGPGEFRHPFDVALGPKGQVYVADTDNQRVQAFDHDGAFLWSYGPFFHMHDPRRLDHPKGIAVDQATGRVYVADTENHRIVVLDANGNLDFDFTVGFRLNRPHHLVVRHDQVFIANTGAQQVVVCERDGVFLYDWPVAPPSPNPGPHAPTRGPVGIALDENTNSYVTDQRTSEILCYDKAGNLRGSFGRHGAARGMLDQPTGLAMHHQSLVVADTGNHRVVITDEKVITWQVIGGAPFPLGHLLEPQHCAFAPEDDLLYVVDAGNQRVQAFHGKSGAPAFALEAPGMTAPWGVATFGREVYVTDNTIDQPMVYHFRQQTFVASFDVVMTGSVSYTDFQARGLAVDPATGNVWVTDTYNNRLVPHDPSGGPALALTPTVASTPQLNEESPSDVLVTRAGQLIVANPDVNELIYTPVAAPVWNQAVEHHLLNYVVAITVDEQRSLLYAVTHDQSLVQGSFLLVIDLEHIWRPVVTQHLTNGGGPGQLFQASGVALDTLRDRLFITEAGNNRVQVLQIHH